MWYRWCHHREGLLLFIVRVLIIANKAFDVLHLPTDVRHRRLMALEHNYHLSAVSISEL